MPYQGRLPYTYKSPFNTTLDQGTQTVPSLAFLGDTNNGLFSPATDNVAITTNGSEKLRVTDTGFVGIGITNPDKKLIVYGSGGNFVSEFYNTNDAVSNNGVYIRTRNTNSATYPLTVNSGIDGSNQLFLIRGDGNVGIGTTNPSEKLEVVGKFRLFDAGYPYIDIGVTTSNYFRLIHDNPNDRFYIGKNNNVTLVITGANNVEPGLDNSYNLGSPTKRWANIYSADLQLSNEGSSNDVDGTWGKYTIQEGENDLYLLNRRNGKKYKFVLQEVN